MKGRYLITIIGGLTLAALVSTPAFAQTRKGNLEGFQEVTPISTTGNGNCKAKISKDKSSIEVELRYSDLEGSISQAHIHFGQPGVNGGIALFLCTNLGNGPAGTPECPASPDTVTRTLVAADVVGPATQGIAAGELAEVIEAILDRTAYCNVHTSLWAGGEIRGQLK